MEKETCEQNSLCVVCQFFWGMKPKSEKLECKLFASQNNKSLGIDMNIVSNVGQMFNVLCG